MASPPPSPPLREQIRYLRRIFQKPQPVLDELASAYGPIVGLGIGPLKMAIIGQPAALGEMFATPVDAFRWNHRFNVLGFVVGPESLIVSDGEPHRRRRKAVQSAFSRKRLNRWIPMIVARADQAVAEAIERGPGPVDLYPVGRSLVLDVAIAAFFGPDMLERSEEIGHLMQAPQDYLESPAIRQIPHPLPATKRARVRANRRRMDAIIDEAIARRRSSPAGDPDDVLDVLVRDGELTDGEIRDQVVTLIGAGYDTTAATLAWMLLRAASTDGVWHRLREEAREVLPDDPQDADHTTLAGLEFADRVVRETLRLHPAGVLSPREATRDVDLGGHRIAKGTMVLWSPHLAGRDVTAWREPLRFDPDRFAELTDDQRATIDAAWVPFGGGVRNCIGFALAQIELTLVVSRLAQHLEVTPSSASIPEPVGMVVNRPTGGAWLTVAQAEAVPG